MEDTVLEVRRDDITVTRRAQGPPPTDATVLRVERFGLSSNNVTYAQLGDAMGYWSFFPAADGWGRIPAWGVLRAEPGGALPEGSRWFGYCPMGSHLAVVPEHVGEAGFTDATPHRAQLPPAYNAYTPFDGDEDVTVLLRPLFFLAFFLDDFLAENDFFDARTVFLSSASSKTSLSTAFLLARRDVEVVGLTSPSRAATVEELGVYDRVVTYDEAGRLPREPSVYLDMAGSAPLRRAVHEQLGDDLRHSAIVGLTHHGAPQDPAPIPGPPPAFFFVPDHMRTRAAEWGQAAMRQRTDDAWREVADWGASWLRVERADTFAALEFAYASVVAGGADPRTGVTARLDL